MDKPFLEIKASGFRLNSQPTVPYIEGYRPHNDIDKSNKFPHCCDFHSQTIKALDKWFEEDFPKFTKEEEEAYGWWFKKSYFKGLPVKIITQLSYTEYFIKNKINSKNWYNDIRHYIDYNIWSFGMPALGFSVYVSIVKYYLQKVDEEIIVEKRDKIIAYLDSKLNPEIKEVDEKDKTDFNVIYATIQKWLNLFPFGLEVFSEFKKQYDRKWLLIKSVDDYNPYIKRYKIKTITKSELLDLLISTTKELLKRIKAVDFVKKGESIQKLYKYKLDILIESHSLKQQKLLNDFSPDEYTYINILEVWFDNEKIFLDGISELINSGSIALQSNPQSTYLKTFETSFSKIQLEGLRVLLLEYCYISEISNDDFIYLFQGKPIVLSMKRLDWLIPNSWCHYLLKEMVFKGINFNMKQVNSCIIGKDGKKLNSNSGRGGYREIDDILKEIRG